MLTMRLPLHLPPLPVVKGAVDQQCLHPEMDVVVALELVGRVRCPLPNLLHAAGQPSSASSGPPINIRRTSPTTTTGTDGLGSNTPRALFPSTAPPTPTATPYTPNPPIPANHILPQLLTFLPHTGPAQLTPAQQAILGSPGVPGVPGVPGYAGSSGSGLVLRKGLHLLHHHPRWVHQQFQRKSLHFKWPRHRLPQPTQCLLGHLGMAGVLGRKPPVNRQIRLRV
ncbi:hypothetical protein H257_11500 [Aphanomyces astaci]|uniref:Uncharacterized protein n=1 Tax=Aphanomyces astaci TaxID=112090 RepID=W4G2C0_APHAT|nr:hypothetical protein H257_11500 [Aphanomyces astaci]ETV73830.1 hypothetical protein H257_11500 [Aphanomyces astaci]|eukprot:XP_009836766.1 hypothetical protein H257_11500 [Aphanomyces astaci]